MQIDRIVPLVTTRKLAETREFFTKHFGFTITFDSPGYLGLEAPGGKGLQIAFMPPDDAAPAPFSGQGLMFGIEVPDVDAEHARLAARGVDVGAGPQDNPWGDRSFQVREPSGVTLHIHSPRPMTPEYARYART